MSPIVFCTEGLPVMIADFKTIVVVTAFRSALDAKAVCNKSRGGRKLMISITTSVGMDTFRPTAMEIEAARPRSFFAGGCSETP